jgi:type IV pilus assembly protein PilW
VRSVLFAIVTKTLQTDPKYSAPATITLASPTPGPDSFTNYTVPNGTGGGPDYTHNRFSVLESEVAIRNQIWPH